VQACRSQQRRRPNEEKCSASRCTFLLFDLKQAQLNCFFSDSRVASAFYACVFHRVMHLALVQF
jgi:hypothetical protein